MAPEKAIPIQMLFQDRGAHRVQQEEHDVLIRADEILIRQGKRLRRRFRAELFQDGIGQVDQAAVIIRQP